MAEILTLTDAEMRAIETRALLIIDANEGMLGGPLKADILIRETLNALNAKARGARVLCGQCGGVGYVHENGEPV